MKLKDTTEIVLAVCATLCALAALAGLCVMLMGCTLSFQNISTSGKSTLDDDEALRTDPQTTSTLPLTLPGLG